VVLLALFLTLTLFSASFGHGTQVCRVCSGAAPGATLCHPVLALLSAGLAPVQTVLEVGGREGKIRPAQLV